jgi:hypothetical protein
VPADHFWLDARSAKATRALQIPRIEASDDPLPIAAHLLHVFYDCRRRGHGHGVTLLL